MASSVVSADTVRIAIDQVFDILGSLQKKVEPRQGSTPTVDIHQYRTKCSELDELASRYRSKCQEYDRLLSRYTQLSSSAQELSRKSATGARCKDELPSASKDPFIELNALEHTMLGLPTGNSSNKRSNGSALVSPENLLAGGDVSRAAATTTADSTTPTKRPRRGTFGSGLPGILSSPLAARKPLLTFNLRGRAKPVSPNTRLAQQATMSSPPPAASDAASAKTSAAVATRVAVERAQIPALHSSQETQLDFSDPPVPVEDSALLCPGTNPSEAEADGANSAWQFMLKTPDKHCSGQERAAAAAESQRVCAQQSPELQRILDAVGDCEPCRSFYSVPGLVLPKRDPSTLCQHRGRGKGKAADWRALAGKDATANPASSSMPVASAATAPRPARGPFTSDHDAVRQAPKSERRRPTTPDHFWDIDYFPPIKTLGLGNLRKERRQSTDSS
ncbi:hypothetical protein GGI02_004310 [Coemansia sp. RSA 2322]|nr:hypothetical protein GGI02_004310 [Coemansia sp. RSA 2322]